MQIFELFGSILLKDNGVEGQIDKIDNKAQKTSKSFGSMIGTAAKWGAALAVAVGGVAVASIKDAAEAESSLAQLDAVLKSTGGTAGVTRQQLTDLADGLEKTTKFSAESTQAAESLLLTFTNIGKDVFPEATKTALDMATALGGDAAGQSIALGKALNDPIKGITALSRVGVSFTEDQKKQIKVMQESGNIMGAQKIILAELAKEFGGSAEAAGKTFAGQLIIAKNALGNVTETIGTALLPMLTKFLNWVTPSLPAIADFFTKAFDTIGKWVTETIIPAFQKFYAWIEPHIPEIKKFISDMVDIVVPKFQKIVDIVKEIAGKIFPDFKNGTTNISDEVKKFTTTALNVVIIALTWLRDNIPLVKGVLAAFTAVWVIHKGVVLAHNIVQAAHNIHLAYTNALLLLGAIRTGAMTIATGAQTIATGAGTIAMGAFNLVMSLNPIVLVIASLALLGIAIYEVVKHWKDICEWIGKAWDWLTTWNGTPAKDKSSTVTTNYKDTGATGGLTKSHNASGTDFWQGGETWVNEVGGEIMDLPTGTRIIPHDVSMEMARNSNKNNISNNETGNGLTLSITNFINNRKEDIEELAQEIEMYRQMKSRALGGTT